MEKPETLKSRISQLTINEVSELLQLTEPDDQYTSEGRPGGLVAFVTLSQAPDELAPDNRREIDPEALRRHLEPRLPQYMIPLQFLVVDSLPLTRTGKVDRNALVELYASNHSVRKSARPEQTEMERVLAGIWESVLGISGVEPEDDFFELGGDSILSIRITSLARQAGIDLAPGDLFEASTVRGLASLTAARRPATQAAPDAGGSLNLTPIQHWFFELADERPAHWNQALVVDIPRELRPGQVETLLHHLVRQHGSLRLRFEKVDGCWTQRIVDSPTAIPVRLADISHIDLGSRSECAHAIISEEHELGDPTVGLPVRFALLDTGDEKWIHLAIVIHHLAVDIVSWTYLLEDLDSLIDQALSGLPPTLPAGSATFADWSRALAAYARSDDLASQVDYWEKQAPEDDLLPCDYEVTPMFVESDVDVVTSGISPQETESLFGRLPATFSARPHEVVLAACLRALKDWTGADRLVIGMEGHGRHSPDDAIDISRTIGWFTAFYPLAFDLRGLTRDLHYVARVKESIRTVPGSGVGYGVLRYIASGKARESVSEHASPQIVFNFHGGNSPWQSSYRRIKAASLPTGRARRPDFRRAALIEINCGRTAEGLEIDWQYSRKVHAADSIRSVADASVFYLREMIDQALTSEDRGYSTADFPDTGLTQDQLERLLKRIKDSSSTT